VQGFAQPLQKEQVLKDLKTFMKRVNERVHKWMGAEGEMSERKTEAVLKHNPKQQKTHREARKLQAQEEQKANIWEQLGE